MEDRERHRGKESGPVAEAYGGATGEFIHIGDPTRERVHCKVTCRDGKKEREYMSKSRASKLNGYRSAVSRQRNDVYKFKPKRGKKNGRKG